MNAPRPTTLVHPVTDVGSFFAFGGRREVGVVLGRKVALPIGGGQEYRSVNPVYSTGDSGGRVGSFDFRACEVFGATYWGICRWNSSCARTPFLVRRAASTVRRMAWIVAVSHARCSGAITRHAIKGSRCSLGIGRCTPAIARRAVGAKIRTVRPTRRTRRVIRWSFLTERVQESVKRRAVAQSAVECGPDVSGLPLFPASLLAMSLLASRSRVATCLRSGCPVSRRGAFFYSARRATPAGWRGESGSPDTSGPHSAVLRTLNSQHSTII